MFPVDSCGFLGLFHRQDWPFRCSRYLGVHWKKTNNQPLKHQRKDTRSGWHQCTISTTNLDARMTRSAGNDSLFVTLTMSPTLRCRHSISCQSRSRRTFTLRLFSSPSARCRFCSRKCKKISDWVSFAENTATHQIFDDFFARRNAHDDEEGSGSSEATSGWHIRDLLKRATNYDVETGKEFHRKVYNNELTCTAAMKRKNKLDARRSCS